MLPLLYKNFNLGPFLYTKHWIIVIEEQATTIKL